MHERLINTYQSRRFFFSSKKKKKFGEILFYYIKYNLIKNQRQASRTWGGRLRLLQEKSALIATKSLAAGTATKFIDLLTQHNYSQLTKNKLISKGLLMNVEIDQSVGSFSLARAAVVLLPLPCSSLLIIFVLDWRPKTCKS